MNKAKKIVLVSGGFDPIHPGHIKMILEAKKLGDELVAVVNNDNWLMKKKGYCFMNEKERQEVVGAIKGVDKVVLTKHPKDPEDMSICNELKEIKPDIFANGGDRKSNNIPEYSLCNDLGIKMVFNVGGEKEQSSSDLVRKIQSQNINKTK